MNKRRKDKTVFVGFYSRKGGVGKSTALFSLLCLITGNGVKNTDKVCVINCDHSSLSIKNIMEKNEFTTFHSDGTVANGIEVDDNTADGLLSFARDALYSPQKRNIRYVLIDFAGFQMTADQLSKIKDLINLWIIPVYPSDMSEHSIAKVYTELTDIGVEKHNIITYINKLKPERFMSQSMINKVSVFIESSDYDFPKDTDGSRIDSEFLGGLESDSKKQISLISNGYCKQLFSYVYNRMKNIWEEKNSKINE